MSFSSDGSSRQAIQAIQFELWPDCYTGCKYCYLNGTPRNTTQEQKIKNIQETLKTLRDSSVMKDYNAVGLIGGDFFQGQLDGIHSYWSELICQLDSLLKTQQIKEVWLATSLLFTSAEDLITTLGYFDFNSYTEDQRVTLCTSYDTIGRFVENNTEDEETTVFTKTFYKNSSLTDVENFVSSIGYKVDTDVESDYYITAKEIMPHTEKINKHGLVLLDGTKIDLESATNFNDYLNKNIFLNYLMLNDTIKVDFEQEENISKAKLYFLNTDNTFCSKQKTFIRQILKEYDETEIFTVFPAKEYNELFIESSEKTWKTKEVWLNNIKQLRKAYPKLTIHIQTILTQDAINTLLENPDYFDFITDLGCIIDFRYPSISRADCPTVTGVKDYRAKVLETREKFPENFFIEDRSKFLKFLKVFKNKYGLNKVRDLLHQPEMRSRRLKIYIDNAEILDRWHDSRDIYSECGHLVDGKCYIDSEKCLYCDVTKFIENEENI